MIYLNINGTLQAGRTDGLKQLRRSNLFIEKCKNQIIKALARRHNIIKLKE
jgi:hypothetical protein